jgi:LmbE family N-acetylglucosaminyl deacetylase
MLPLSFGNTAAPLRILCLSAHSDDIEIGCGGTVLRLLEERPASEVHWVVFSANGARESEARASAESFLTGARAKAIVTKSFRESYFPAAWTEIKDFFEETRRAFEPDLVLTHHPRDLHQDHRVVAELSWNTFRNHLVLEYEIPKYDGDLGNPNFFVPLEQDVCRRKVRNVLVSFPSQASKPWFREDLFLALMRLRGMECHAPSGYAEGFCCRKAVLGGPGGRARSSRSR